MDLNELSKLKDKPTGYDPRHRLLIDGQENNDVLKSASITYTSEGGGSGCQLILSKDWREFDNADLTLELGYGDLLEPYFVGKLQRPKYDRRLNFTSAMAFGPFRIMADQILDDEESFAGASLAFVLKELTSRAGFLPGQAEIRGGNEIIVDVAEYFPFETSLHDVANSVMEKSGYIGMDQPGGKRLFMKRPRPGIFGSSPNVFQPDQYFIDGFQVEPKAEITYHKVTVVRVNSSGVEQGKHPRIVKRNARFAPPVRRVLVVSGFYGTQVEAEQEAEDLSRFMRIGDNGFTLNTHMNPTIKLYDPLSVEEVVRGVRTRYDCLVNGDITVEYIPATTRTPGTATMSITGDAMPTVEEPEPFVSVPRLNRRNSSVVIPDPISDMIMLPSESLLPSDELLPSEV